MNELVINGWCFQVEEEGFGELTVFGENSIDFINEIVESGGVTVVQKLGYYANEIFLEVLGVGMKNGERYIRVRTRTLRHL